MLEKLRELGIRDDLIDEIKKFRESYPAEKSYEARIPKLEQFYYGKDVWEQAITAILCGQNLLLVGHKATGKNLFAENLAGVFMRPRWDVSFHVNMDAASLIGMDTFRGGEVTFRPGPVYTAAKQVVLRCWMKLTWQKVKLWQCCTQHWIFVGPLTFRGMKE